MKGEAGRRWLVGECIWEFVDGGGRLDVAAAHREHAETLGICTFLLLRIILPSAASATSLDGRMLPLWPPVKTENSSLQVLLKRTTVEAYLSSHSLFE
jgi:hypothetical protein